MKLYEKIKQLRLDNHMTQKELANKLGISIPTLQKYEYGDYKIKNEIIVKISEIFDVPIEELLNISNENSDISQKIQYKEIIDITGDREMLFQKEWFNYTFNGNHMSLINELLKNLGYDVDLSDLEKYDITKFESAIKAAQNAGVTLKYNNTEIKISLQNYTIFLRLLLSNIENLTYNFFKLNNIQNKDTD